MAGEGRGLICNPLHHVAVTTYGVNLVIEDRELGPIEPLCKPAGRQRHAHTVAASLAERSGRGFHASGEPMFGMAGAGAAELPDALNGLEGDAGGRPPLPGPDR